MTKKKTQVPVYQDYHSQEHPYQDMWNEWNLLLDRKKMNDPCGISDLFKQFGEWEQVKGHIDTMIADENYYQNLADILEQEKQKEEERAEIAEGQVKEICGEIENISSWLDTILGDIEDEEVGKKVQAVIGQLDNLVTYKGLKKEPVKVKQKKRKV